MNKELPEEPAYISINEPTDTKKEQLEEPPRITYCYALGRLVILGIPSLFARLFMRMIDTGN